MSSQNKQLAVLSKAEKAAFYECPDFDEAQRFEYLTLTEEELQIVLKRQNLGSLPFLVDVEMRRHKGYDAV